MHRRDILKGAVRGAGLCALPAAWRAHAAGPSAAPQAGPYDWRSVPFGGGGFVNGFVVHPREAGLLYARTDIGGAYRFDTASAAWVPLLDHLSKADADLMGVLCLAIDPADADRLYLACGLYTGEWSRKAALLSSSDRGATWTAAELGIRLGGNEAGRGSGERLQVDPFNGDILLLGTTRDGLMKSRDRGKTFSRLPFPGQHVSLVLCDPERGTAGAGATSIFAGSHDRPGLYASHDRGETFAREPGTPELAPQRAVFGPNGTLYVTFAGGEPGSTCNPGFARTGSVWKRSRDGRWTDITPAKPGKTPQGFGYSGLDVDRQQPGRILVSTIERWSEGDDVFASADDGATWTALGARSRHDASPYPWLVGFTRGQDKMGHWISDLKIDPFDGNRALYGTGFGVWMTRELGAAHKDKSTVVNWHFAVANLEETAALEVKSPSGGATLLAAMGDVSGAAWDDVTKTPQAGLFVPSHETNRSVDSAALNPAVVARTSDAAATGGYWSPDGGASWRPFGPSPRVARSPEGHSMPTGRIAVSAKGGFFLWVPDKQPALWSRDRGKTWQVSQGWPADRGVALEPVADRAIEGVFYVHDRVNGLILASVDGGQGFKAVASGLPKVEAWQASQLLAAPGGVRDLWLALPQGLLHLPGPDRPAKTMAGVAEAWMIALGKGAPDAPYHSLYVWGSLAVGGEGLFRSDDVGLSFRRVDDARHRYGRLLSLAADPLEHGTVYLAPHGRGVVVGRPRGSP